MIGKIPIPVNETVSVEKYFNYALKNRFRPRIYKNSAETDYFLPKVAGKSINVYKLFFLY